jgi:hypothetical protein
VKRDVFCHCAYEVYPDLLAGMRALLPLVIANDMANITTKFVELDREAHARNSRPYPVASDEADRTRARLAAFDLHIALPDIAADGKWRYLQRSLARLERVRELAGPVELFRDSFLEGAHGLTAQPYVAPVDLGWLRACDFVADAIALAATTHDDVGIGEAINEIAEAHAFFERHPDAYSFWDIHSAPRDEEEADLPDPLRYPDAIWSAPAIALAEAFADLPCGNAGPATLQPVEARPGGQLHPALAKTCETAARRGYAVVGFVDVRP